MATFNGTTLNDTLFGSGLADLLYGLAGNDSISGGALGDDTLDGGTGSDTLGGGTGNDLYVVDSTRDVIQEGVGDTDDRIQATITIDLNSAAYANIEHVTLTGTGALNATGDDDANMLIGNSGANKLDGRVGADTMAGGAGNDTYTVDNDKDVVNELAGDGTDQVNASDDFTLGAFIENLTLTGSVRIAGTGNTLANKITGNDNNNTLDGDDGNDTLTGNGGDDTLDGGTGADSMSGGTGNDTYEVDDVGDKITESGPSTDRDHVDSAITYTLGSNLEELFLQGTLAIDGTGNSLNNLITGNFNFNTLSGLAGNDTLNGFAGGGNLLMGGDGNDELQGESNGDRLVGGAGNDTFKFFASSGKDQDLVADFNGLPGGDLIDVSDLLNGKGVTTANVGKFLGTLSGDGSTTLGIDTSGGGNFVDLAILQGVSTDLDGLLANASILGIGTLTATTLIGTSAADTLAAGAKSQLVQGLGGNDSLTGGKGSDTLDGGTGSDSLTGGKGDDTYIIDSTRDIVSETGGDANDRIQASISIDLNSTAYAEIEHVTLTGTSGLSATGDEFANMLIGNTLANKLDGGTLADTMIGGAGNDTYTVDDSKDSIVEYANEGTDQVNSSATKFVLSDFVENLTLTGTADIDGFGNELANKITGNDGANELDGRKGNDTLTGNDGDDILDGGQGADSMSGGKGNDQYIVDDAGDKISETGAATDVDTVFSDISYVLGATLENLDIDGLGPLDGTGNTLANAITGNTAANVLSGLAGNDSLDGGLGDDLLLGGDGNDTLISNDGTDTLVGGAGSDVFQIGGRNGSTIADFDAFPGGDAIDLASLLPSGLTAKDAPNLLLTQTVEGSTTLFVDKDGSGLDFKATVVLRGVSTDVAGLLANASIIGVDGLVATPLVGTSASETLAVAAAAASTLLQGLGGNDQLVGGDKGFDTLDGGTGSDTLVGGGGSDTYIVDSTKDVISEQGNDTDDRIQASISIDLNAAAYAGIEHVTLTGTGALNATGGPDLVSNLLIGNAGNNILDGKGGDDQLAGGAGNDTYVVDSLDDLIFENPGEGTDQVNASTGYTLSANVENLTLTGTDNTLGEGNDLANKIIGNSGNNFLLGHDGNDTLTGNEGNDTLDGGPGTDSMTGGTGDDTYDVDSSTDKVAESANGGTDTVAPSISYTLGSNLENLSLQGGLDPIDGTGNTLNNLITGNSGHNVLSGLAGNDTLEGALGDDLLLGGDGADVLQANAGADTLAGGAGSDRFEFNNGGLDGLDHITDFTSAPGGDVLDVSDLLTGFNPATSNINDFLQAVENNGSTTIRVDTDGSGSFHSPVDMVVLDGVNTDILGLLSNGSLVLAD